MIPRYGDVPDPRQTYVTRPGVYAVLTHGDGILLTLQERPRLEVQLPGGGVDPGEQMLRALHREVAEETGWRIAGPRRVGTFKRFTYMPEYDIWAEKVCHVYAARPVRRIGDPTEPGHHALWADASSALRLLGNPGDVAMLRRMMKVRS